VEKWAIQYPEGVLSERKSQPMEEFQELYPLVVRAAMGYFAQPYLYLNNTPFSPHLQVFLQKKAPLESRGYDTF
jgi:hypothetical protein